MKNLIIVVVVCALAITGMAFYQGWFKVGGDSTNDKSNVSLSVDKNKIKEDTQAAVAKVEDAGHQLKDKVTGTSEKSMDGTVVSVSAEKLTMTNKEGKEHDHALAANVKVTCDGKACAVADLKAGMRIRVTADHTSHKTASRIEALDKDQEFKKGA